MVKKQLKKEFPNWNRLTKKEKKNISNQVLEEVFENYDENEAQHILDEELLGIENQHSMRGIKTLQEMAEFIEKHQSGILFKFKSKTRNSHIQDEELQIIDGLLDDDIINSLLSYEGYTPAMREYFPCTFLRAELLKALKYPEISYRKFCGDDKQYKGYKVNNDYTGKAQKQNRSFIGLSLIRNQMLSHSQLCQFRSSLSFAQLMNLMVYILHKFMETGILGQNVLHCVDSSELAVECCRPLATLKIANKNIRIYNDLDCDCGKRRKKRDKSIYVVGYRLHTLTAIDPASGQSYPLISLLAPANHHDSNFLLPLTRIAQAIGLDVKLISADEAYNDSDGKLLDQTGVHLVKPASSKVSMPENVDASTFSVTYDDLCDFPMEYTGASDEHHEFRCNASFGECHRSGVCPGVRSIPFDNGYFQRIIHGSKGVEEALDIRKNCERPFNLLKKREGLENIRTRSQQGLLARSTFATMATLLLEITGTRKKIKKSDQSHEQLEFSFAVGF